MRTPQFLLHAEIEQRHWWFAARRSIIDALAEEVAPPAKTSLVVDVGCGTGGNAAALSAKYRCVGIDASAEAVELARRRFPNLDFRVGLAPDDLHDVAGQADLWLVLDVLEHVADDRGMLSRLVAAVKPGGHLLLTVPADVRLWSPHDEAFGHFRRYGRAEFERLWAGLPVETRLLSHFNTRLYWPIRLVRAINRRRRRAAGAAGTDFHMPPALVNALLRRLFAGERRRLLAALRCGRGGYTCGASLVALLRRV